MVESDSTQYPPNYQKVRTPLYKKKYENEHNFFFGPEEYHDHSIRGSTLREARDSMERHGIMKFFHDFFVVKHRKLLRMIFVFGIPIFCVAILVMFLAAIVCSFFTGIYLMLRDTFLDFGCLAGILLAPGAIIIGGICGAVFPYLFRSYIIELHYKFWIEFATIYFQEVCSACQ